MSEVNFEMANSADPKDVVAAAQRSVVKLMREVIEEVKEGSGQPGLTWSQIEYLLKMVEEKEATIIVQKEQM